MISCQSLDPLPISSRVHKIWMILIILMIPLLMLILYHQTLFITHNDPPAPDRDIIHFDEVLLSQYLLFKNVDYPVFHPIPSGEYLRPLQRYHQ